MAKSHTERLSALISMLADGAFHSGEALGKALGVTRASVWKMVNQLEQLGLEVYAVSGKGYRLREPFEPLRGDRILEVVGEENSARITALQLENVTDSTSRQLLRAAGKGASSGTVCLAESQSAGRGRRGREWVSPYGANLYVSLLWRFHEGTAHLGGLSLAVAVALMRFLNEENVVGAGIKWPNDILIEGRKLAGILLDVAGEAEGPCYVVIGIGVNYRLSPEDEKRIDQAVTDLVRCGVRHDRNYLIGRLLDHLLTVIRGYEEGGLELFLDEWREWDLAFGHEVSIHYGNSVQTGIARGIDEAGHLLLEQQGKLTRYTSGEVSMRGAFA